VKLIEIAYLGFADWHRGRQAGAHLREARATFLPLPAPLGNDLVALRAACGREGLPGRGGPAGALGAIWVDTVFGTIGDRHHVSHRLNRFASVKIGQIHQWRVALGTGYPFTWINRRRRVV